MLWKIDDNGEPEVVTAKLNKSTSLGWVNVYQVGGQTVVEVSDMAIMGLGHKTFMEKVMPDLRKSLGIQNKKEDAASKLSRLVRGKTTAASEEPSKPFAVPYLSKSIEIIEVETPKEKDKEKIRKKPKND